MLARGRRADHVRPAGLGDLHGEVADAPRRGVDQHPLPRLHVGDVDEALPGRQPGERQPAAASTSDSPAGRRAKCREGAVTNSA